MDNNTLTHWGIKGQKWGVRRYQNADGSLTPAGKKRYGDYEPADQLDDAELRRRINRMQMETQYAQLTAPKKSAGRKFVEEVLLNSSKQIATQYATAYGKKLVDAMIKKATTKATP